MAARSPLLDGLGMRQIGIRQNGAGCRAAEISYSKFISGLKKAGIDLNRKILADMAANDATAFAALVQTAKAAHAGS